jgi:hypothetical protein
MIVRVPFGGIERGSGEFVVKRLGPVESWRRIGVDANREKNDGPCRAQCLSAERN